MESKFEVYGAIVGVSALAILLTLNPLVAIAGVIVIVVSAFGLVGDNSDGESGVNQYLPGTINNSLDMLYITQLVADANQQQYNATHQLDYLRER